MLIDWFTVAAQVLNFVLLVWLMKRFLYQPVLDAIAAREKRIAVQIAAADTKESQATAERKTFVDKNAAFDQQRASLLDKARADAQAEGQRLADEARKAATALAEKREQALALQAAHLQQLIAGRAAHEVFAVARKILADLANVELEDRMVDVFLQHLTDLPAAEKSQFDAALKKNTDPLLVRSRFELATNQKITLQNAINTTFSADVPLHFKTAADAVCGIELSANGQKLAWTISDYLRDLEHEVATMLAPADKPVVAPAPRTDPVDA